MRLNFFEHRTLFYTKNRQFWFDLGHFLWASFTSARIEDKIKKIGRSKPFWTRFYQFSKNYPRSMRFNFFEHRTLFWSPNRQFFVWFGSFFVGKFHLSHSWGWNKKIGQNEPFWTRFYRFSKKYPRSMRLNFFKHQTLFWSPNRQFLSDLAFFVGKLNLSHSWG